MLIPYARQTGDISDHHLELFQLVVSLLDNLDIKLDANCHDVCEVLARLIPELDHIWGWFFRKGQHHSWLSIRGTRIVIDAYPIAGALPFIVTLEGSIANPWNELYLLPERVHDS